MLSLRVGLLPAVPVPEVPAEVVADVAAIKHTHSQQISPAVAHRAAQCTQRWTLRATK